MKKIPAILCFLLLSAGLAAARPATVGEPRYLVVLVEFKDLDFSLEDPAAQFTAMLNESGYDASGATGSVRDYYTDNSHGLYRPQFDVAGPVRLDKKVSAYGKDVYIGGVRVGDQAPELALYEACVQLDGKVDFSLYDADEDGLVDLILFFYAGYDQAAGGPSTTLWSQQWNVQKSENELVTSALFDGVKLGQYIASAELQGSEGCVMTPIGSTCHELGHFLGLPDWYDTNGAVDGSAGGVYNFSLMGTGLYNNEGRTPPSLNRLEQELLGWSGEEIPLIGEGLQKLSAAPGQRTFRSRTATEGEYFLYEYRDGKAWDAPLPPGLLIYHVDRSERKVGEHTALQLWEDWRDFNNLNACADHPCLYLIPSSDVHALAFDIHFSEQDIVFPGLQNLVFYDPVDWDGAYTDIQLTNIGLEEDAVSMHVLHGAGTNINGIVRDRSGRPLADVTLTLEGEDISTCSDRDGFYLLDLPDQLDEKIFSLTAARPGYRTQTLEIALDDGRMRSVPVELGRENQADERPLSQYDRHASMGYFSMEGVLCATRFSVQDLAPYAGRRLSEIAFYPRVADDFEDDVYVMVDIGDRRVLSRKVDQLVKGPYFRNAVDVSEAGIVIPEGLEMYIGYGSATSGTGFYPGAVYPGNRGNSYYTPFSLESSDWKDLYVKEAGIYMDLALSALLSEQTDAASLNDMGYHYIDPGTGPYKAGDRFYLKLQEAESAPLSSVSWAFDGEPVRDTSVVLTEGTHTVHARLKYQDGREEVLELSLKVN